MKFKTLIILLFIVSLVLGLSTTSQAAVPNLTAAKNKDVANVTVAAGDSVVIASFSVTNSSSTEATAIATMTINATATTTLLEADIDVVSVYEDININGKYDTCDVLIHTVSAGELSIWRTPGSQALN